MDAFSPDGIASVGPPPSLCFNRQKHGEAPSNHPNDFVKHSLPKAHSFSTPPLGPENPSLSPYFTSYFNPPAPGQRSVHLPSTYSPSPCNSPSPRSRSPSPSTSPTSTPQRCSPPSPLVGVSSCPSSPSPSYPHFQSSPNKLLPPNFSFPPGASHPPSNLSTSHSFSGPSSNCPNFDSSPSGGLATHHSVSDLSSSAFSCSSENGFSSHELGSNISDPVSATPQKQKSKPKLPLLNLPTNSSQDPDLQHPDFRPSSDRSFFLRDSQGVPRSPPSKGSVIAQRKAHPGISSWDEKTIPRGRRTRRPVGRKTESMRRGRLTPLSPVQQQEQDQVNLAALPLYELPSDDEVRRMDKAITSATRNLGIGQAFWYLLDLFGRTTPQPNDKEEVDPAVKNREFVDQLGAKIIFQNVELTFPRAVGGSSPNTTNKNGDTLFKISIDSSHLLMDSATEELNVSLSMIKDFHILPDKALVSISWADGEEDGEGVPVRTVGITSPEVLDIYTALIYYLNAQMVESAKQCAERKGNK